MGFSGLQRLILAGIPHVLSEEQVDIMSAFSTDGRIAEFDLIPLPDNRHHFLPYEAIPMVSQSGLDELPESKESLQKLGVQISNQQMIKLYHKAQVIKQELASIIKTFINQIKASNHQ